MVVAKRTAREGWPASLHSAVRLPLLLLGLAAALGAGADAAWVFTQPVPAADVGVERAVQSVQWGPVFSLFTAVDWLEGLKQVAVAVAGVLAVAIFRRRALLLMIWGALSGALYTVVELATQRPRPDAHLVHVFRHTTGWSFPSGHAVFFTWFIAYLLLIFCRRLPRAVYAAGWVLQALVLAVVALGRIDTGEHWPSDVLAGLLLGAAWALVGLSIRRLSDPVLDGR